MVNDLYRKIGPLFIKKNLVQLAFQFFISALIGVIYAFMIIDETIGGYINKVLPSKDGPDLYHYLPIVITVLIYSCFIQRKERIFIEKNFIQLSSYSNCNTKLYFFSYRYNDDSIPLH
jgi:hypothetical protein